MEFVPDIKLVGKVVNIRKLSNFNSEQCYAGVIKMTRPDGNMADAVHFIVLEQLLPCKPERILNKKVEMQGEARTVKLPKTAKLRRRLSIYVQSMKMVPLKESDVNEVAIVGTLLPNPTIRLTSSDRAIADFRISIERENRSPDYIPCIAWTKNATEIMNQKIDAIVLIKGRFESRNYMKADENGIKRPMTTYEVSASELYIL